MAEHFSSLLVGQHKHCTWTTNTALVLWISSRDFWNRPPYSVILKVAKWEGGDKEKASCASCTPCFCASSETDLVHPPPPANWKDAEDQFQQPRRCAGNRKNKPAVHSVLALFVVSKIASQDIYTFAPASNFKKELAFSMSNINVYLKETSRQNHCTAGASKSSFNSLDTTIVTIYTRTRGDPLNLSVENTGLPSE